MTQQELEHIKSEETLPETDSTISRRNHRGCKSKDFYNWPEQSFEDMDSPLAVQQYIQQTIRKDPSNIDEILNLPEGQDLGAWKIEHLRLFCMQLNRLATKLQDCCHPSTCNQMTATEQWIFLCAAHKQPNECPAIDYTRHTLDGAASLLNSNKYFPSRVTIKESSVAKLGSVCRRVYRIFSHAYYHHFQEFDEYERETHLCKRFSKFVTIYELMSKESLIVPSDGSKPEMESNINNQQSTQQEAAVGVNTVNATTTIIGPQPQQTDLAEDALKQEKSIVGGETTTKSVAQMANSDTRIKKAANDELSTSNPVSTTWTPSLASTNTMVKGSPSVSIAKANFSEESATKAISGDTVAVTSTPTNPAPRGTSSSKNGVESEA